MKTPLLIGILAIFTSCADAIFEIPVEAGVPECLEVEHSSTENIQLKLYTYHGENNDELRIITGNRNKTIKGNFSWHQVQLEKGNRMSYPHFLVFESKNCRFVLEHKKMNDQLYLVNDERVINYYEEKTNGNNK